MEGNEKAFMFISANYSSIVDGESFLKISLKFRLAMSF